MLKCTYIKYYALLLVIIIMFRFSSVCTKTLRFCNTRTDLLTVVQQKATMYCMGLRVTFDFFSRTRLIVSNIHYNAYTHNKEV